MSITLSQLNTDEVLRYMGTPPEKATEELLTLVRDCSARMLAVMQARWTWQLCALSFTEEGVLLDCNLLLPGRDLSAHLRGCSQAFLFCATLGAQADSLIRQAECSNLLHALALDCCAGVAVEHVCDCIEQTLQANFPNAFFPYRFSPGYGDLPLSVQQDLLDLLHAPLRIGLCATNTHILTPRKSVTAILGVCDRPIEQHKRSCIGCPASAGCQHRKTGGHCGFS